MDDATDIIKIDDSPQIHHAVIVLNRILRSRRRADERLQDLVVHATQVTRVTSQAATATIKDRPNDILSHIAVRVVRSINNET